jgi:hypothetical protein
MLDSAGNPNRASSPIRTDPWPYAEAMSLFPRHSPVVFHSKDWNKEFVYGGVLSGSKTKRGKKKKAGLSDELRWLRAEGKRLSRKGHAHVHDDSAAPMCPIFNLPIDVEDLSGSAFLLESIIVSDTERRESVMQLLPPLYNDLGESGSHHSLLGGNADPSDTSFLSALKALSMNGARVLSAGEAVQLWERLLVSIQECAIQIKFEDLVEIAQLRNPHPFIEGIIIYICILLGLEPSWDAAKHGLFKALIPFQRFLIEVDPERIPVRRLKAAVYHRAVVLKGLTVEMLADVSIPAGRLMK